MKKILAVVLALTMIVGMSLPVFAEVDTDYEVEALDGSKSFEVMATYNMVNPDSPVYAVNISWNNVSFAYEETQGSWDPDTLTYKAEEVTGEWSAEEAAVSISVENRSNKAVVATAAWADGETDLADATFTTNGINLQDAVALEGPENAGTIVGTVTINDGAKINGATKLGTITVTITAA